MNALVKTAAETGLARYDAARYALQEAVAVDEVKNIRDKALAMAAYAKQAGDTALIEMATEIRVRAERKAGEMLAAMPKATGAKGVGPIAVPQGYRNGSQTLAELGVTKKQSARWQKLAAVPEDQFEEAVAAAKEVAGEVTARAVMAHGKASAAPVTSIGNARKAADDTPPEYAGGDEPDAGEIAAIEERERIERAAFEKMLGSDDALAAANQEIKRLAAELAVVKGQRDQYMNRCNELVRQIRAMKRAVA